MSSTELPIHVSADPPTCVFVAVFEWTSIHKVLRGTPADNAVVGSIKNRRNAICSPSDALFTLGHAPGFFTVVGSTKMFWSPESMRFAGVVSHWYM